MAIDTPSRTPHHLHTHCQHTFWPKYFYRTRIWIVGNIFELLLRQGAQKSWEAKNMITVEMSDEYFPHFTRLRRKTAGKRGRVMGRERVMAPDVSESTRNSTAVVGSSVPYFKYKQKRSQTCVPAAVQQHAIDIVKISCQGHSSTLSNIRLK